MWTIIARDASGTEVASAELKDGALTIGRGKNQDLVLPSSSVSRNHARLEIQGGKLVFTDVGSANGSVIDGAKVSAPVEIDEGITVEISPFRLNFEKACVPEGTMILGHPPPAGPSLPEPERAETPSPQAPKPGDWETATAELERQIQGIRMHREQVDTSARTRLIRLDQDWGRVVENLRELKAKMKDHPRLMGFDVSRDGKEVAVKLQDAREKLGYRYFLISRSHPEGKFPTLNAVWLREVGREDQHYGDPKQAMSDLLQRIAATLA